MSSFILRIIFSGLIVFIPGQNKVTVLLLNVDHANHLSDGSALPAHHSVLIARAGGCSGDCTTNDPDTAKILFNDLSADAATSSLQAAAGEGGSVWALDRSEITMTRTNESDADLPPFVLRTGLRGSVNGVADVIPTTSLEREDFSWLADLHQVCPDCTVDPAYHDAQPPLNVAARFEIENGTLSTYTLERIGSNVTPVQFKRLDGTGDASSYSQAVAAMMQLNVAISGESVRFTETKFAGGTGRSMVLTPDADGKADMLFTNLPSFAPPASAFNNAPQVGKHYESFYSITEQDPAPETRLVPFAGAAPTVGEYPSVAWADVHPADALYSPLLNALRLNAGRSAYDRLLCPPTQATP